MNIFKALDISASALQAQKTRMNTISSNLANIQTTRTPAGGPYRKKSVVFESTPVNGFEEHLSRAKNEHAQGVRVAEIQSDQSPFKKIYDPAHPDADENGFVQLPNVNLMAEIADMMSATRSYEANVTVIKSVKRMALKSLEIGK